MKDSHDKEMEELAKKRARRETLSEIYSLWIIAITVCLALVGYMTNSLMTVAVLVLIIVTVPTTFFFAWKSLAHSIENYLHRRELKKELEKGRID